MPDEKKFQLGFERKLYRNSGTDAAPTWVEIPEVKDVKQSLKTGEADVTTRANAGWKALAPTLSEAEFTFQMISDPTNDNFAAVKTAFFAKAPIQFAFADGEITEAGTEYLKVTCGIFGFDITEENESAVTVDVSIKPTYAAAAPQFVTIGV